MRGCQACGHVLGDPGSPAARWCPGCGRPTDADVDWRTDTAERRGPAAPYRPPVPSPAPAPTPAPAPREPPPAAQTPPPARYPLFADEPREPPLRAAEQPPEVTRSYRTEWSGADASYAEPRAATDDWFAHAEDEDDERRTPAVWLAVVVMVLLLVAAGWWYLARASGR